MLQDNLDALRFPVGILAVFIDPLLFHRKFLGRMGVGHIDDPVIVFILLMLGLIGDRIRSLTVNSGDHVGFYFFDGIGDLLSFFTFVSAVLAVAADLAFAAGLIIIISAGIAASGK